MIIKERRKKVSKSITSGNEEGLTVNIGRLRSLNGYEITEDELERLESGGSDPVFLNVAIFSISVALSFFITLLTVKMESNKLFIIFLVVTIIGFLAGFVLLILWWRSRRSVKDLVKRIKERLSQNNLNSS